MDGFHDLGGRQGFGPVTPDDQREPFHEDWEVRVNAMMAGLLKHHVINMDEYRHAVERMEARHYVGASYFERAFTAIATLCVEKGLLTEGELNAAAGHQVTLSRPSAGGRSCEAALPELRIGDTVMVKIEPIAGHVRAPAYVRGKTGVIVGISPPYPFPDAAAHGLSSPRQPTFDVRFQSLDLWPQAADRSEVHVGMFHAYLTKCDSPTNAKAVS